MVCAQPVSKFCIAAELFELMFCEFHKKAKANASIHERTQKSYVNIATCSYCTIKIFKTWLGATLISVICILLQYTIDSLFTSVVVTVTIKYLKDNFNLIKNIE